MADLQRPIDWRLNLAMVWFSQFLSLSAFLFVIPFAPFYLEELGVTDQEELYFLSALFVSLAPISFAIMGPIWGKIGDRYGRKVMMLRAYFGATGLLYAMGSVQEIGEATGLSPVVLLLTLRAIQGILTGTVPAAQALVATSTPEQRMGLALGSLSAAVNAGLASGVFFGGILATRFGYGGAAKAAAGLMGLAAVLVFFGVRENFTPPKKNDEIKPFSMANLFRAILHSMGPGLPLLILMAAISFSLNSSRAILPLFIRELVGGNSREATLYTGYIGAVGAVALAVSGILAGYLSDKFRPSVVGSVAALGTAAFVGLMAICPAILPLFVYRAGMMFFYGGLDPALQAWLTRVTTKERRGSIFGWATSFRSLGWCTGPLAGAWIATATSLRSTFWVQAGLFVLLLPLISWTTAQMVKRGEKGSE